MISLDLFSVLIIFLFVIFGLLTWTGVAFDWDWWWVWLILFLVVVIFGAGVLVGKYGLINGVS